MRSKAISRIVIAIAIVLAAVIFFQSASAAAQTNNSCSDCHSKLAIASHDNQFFVEIRDMHFELGTSCSPACHNDSLNKSTASTFGVWVRSSHSLFDHACEKCHGGNPKAFSNNEAHLGLLNTSAIGNSTQKTCGKCHRQELDESMSSRHYKVEEENVPNCLTCHPAHSVKPMTSSEKEEICGSCHLRFNETCKKCHDSRISASKEAHLSISNTSIVRQDFLGTCGKCHGQELNEFKSSRVFERLESSADEPAPTCIMCHDTHTMRISPKVEDLCIQCHNNETGKALEPDVLENAEKAMSAINELKVEISKAKGAVLSAKAKGKDVNEAEADLKSAKTTLKSISAHWHGFNSTRLGMYETETLNGIAKAQEAEKKAKESLRPKMPGFEALLFIFCLIAAHFLRKNK